MEEAFDKAVAQGQVTQEAPITGKPEVTPPSEAPQIEKGVTQSSTTPQSAPLEEKKTVWDGDVNKLPPEIQDWAKAAQRHLTQKAMAEADLRRAGEEYQQFIQSDDYKSFQNWKTQPQQPKTEETPLVSGVTPEEWEQAQLDMTGKSFNGLIQREVQRQVNEAAQMYGAELNNLRQTSVSTQWREAISSVAEIHPDMVDLHKAGMMKPYIDQELNSGKHKSYEDVVNAAYQRVAAIRDSFIEQGKKADQARIAEKRQGVSATGIATGNAEVMTVDKGDVFNKAFEMALEKKKVKVKSK